MNRDLDSFIEKESDFASEGLASPFDTIIATQSHDAIIKANRIIYKTNSGTNYAIHITSRTIYHQAIYFALASGFQSEWFYSLSNISKPIYYHEARKFTEWLNSNTSSDNKYQWLKEYECFVLNELGNKTSRLGYINQILREGLGSPQLSQSDFNYLNRLLRHSKPVKTVEPQPVTLSEWFSLPWLRSIIGENTYLQLESPSRLFLSFRTTIAVTLQHLLNIRRDWQAFSAQTFDTGYKDWQYDWNRKLIERTGNFDSSGKPSDELTHLLCLDLIKPSQQSVLQEIISKSKLKEAPLQRRYVRKGRSICPWQKPLFFHPDYQTGYSPLEEQLLAWLAACEAIQPSDIPKLRSTDYALEFNSSGRLIAIECSYYKGRSGTNKNPRILIASDPWTKALHDYLQGLPHSVHIFKTPVEQTVKMPGLGKNSNRHNSLGFLLRIWKQPHIQQKINMELTRVNAPPLFLTAIMALENGDESLQQFKKRTGNGAENYKSLVAKRLPTHVFSLSHLKNTAVHAGSDAYRDSDLINHHSHTSTTEKNSYLTDANKDFVNRAGRVTRLVLHDLQNTVYQPSVLAIQQAVYDRDLRTRIVETTGTTDIEIHALDQPIDNTPLTDEILVPDNTDNALVFIHYIRESERMLSKLLSVRPDWVERTLIVQVEWMSRTLSRMRFAKAAEDLYKKLQPYLPPVFDHFLETVE
ncbi:MAG: hypothetical protein CMK89_20610 [Pseudomonadales bacterium]|nr:hypothetical protein [Pseudomonadales bacterium]